MGAILRIIHAIRLRLERIFVVRPGRFAEFGEGTRIRPPLVVYGGHRIKIGKGVVIGPGLEVWMYDENWDASFDPHLTIGPGGRHVVDWNGSWRYGRLLGRLDARWCGIDIHRPRSGLGNHPPLIVKLGSYLPARRNAWAVR